MNLPIKLIISSADHLKKKYGSGFDALTKKLNELCKADKARSLDTRIVFIDDVASAKKAGIKKYSATTAKSCKDAIDALYLKLAPAYIVLLGSQDVMPFVALKNPADDDDKTVPSDLPYACNAKYSTDVKSFMGPSRVVGRIPDIPGDNSTSYLISLLSDIIASKPADVSQFQKYFGVTTYEWKKSTSLTLDHIFGNHKDMLESPPAKGGYSVDALRPQMHFYNCHGAPADPNFYGQKGDNYPESLHALDLTKRITKGTVVAAECCYGAQVFDAKKLKLKSLSIANTYLQEHAAAFCGSSTIAYGPADSQAQADLLTQYFMNGVLNGASTGRSMLEARQKFLTKNGPHLDPYEQKTLAQFYLLGDPSLVPVANPIAPHSMNTLPNRRLVLSKNGTNLGNSMEPSTHVKGAKFKPRKEFKEIFQAAKFTGKEKHSLFTVKAKASGKSFVPKSMKSSVNFRAFVKTKKSKVIVLKEVLVVKEQDSQILGWRLYLSR